jgi:hypothetical protein
MEMILMNRKLFLYPILVLTLLLLPHHTKAAELITNGGFETGNFSGWTAINSAGGWKNWQVSPGVAGGNEGGSFVPVPNATVVTQGNFNAWNGVTGNAGSPYLLYQNITIPVGNFVRMTWSDRYQMNYTQFCTTTCGTATYAVEILNTSNILLQTLYIVNTPTNTNTNTGWVNHIADLTAYQGQTIRIRFRAGVNATLAGPGQLEVDAVSVQTLQPTAAGVSVGGRILTADGMGISRTTVTLTDGAGNSRSAISSSFGYYKFDDVPAGEIYTLTVNHKRYFFADSPRVVNLQDNLADVDFSASP